MRVVHRDDHGPVEDGVGQVADSREGTRCERWRLDDFDCFADDLAAVDGGVAAVSGVDQAAELFVLLGDAQAEVGVGFVEQ